MDRTCDQNAPGIRSVPKTPMALATQSLSASLPAPEVHEVPFTSRETSRHYRAGFAANRPVLASTSSS